MLANQEGAPAVKVVNTELLVSTIWSVEKYFEKLEQMRDAYNAWLSDKSSVPDSVELLFFDAGDTWVDDAALLSAEVGTGPEEGRGVRGRVRGALVMALAS